jgi:hypothetical protein
MNDNTRAKCTACGASLDPYSTEPCPNCGRTGTKKVYKTLTAGVSVAANSEAGTHEHDPEDSADRIRRTGRGGAVMNIGQRAEEQWERTKRYFERFETLSEKGRIHDTNSENYVHDVYSFFIHCYHLKDWIKNDPSSPLQPTAQDFGRKSVSFQICRDLCNGAKHLAVKHPGSNLTEHQLGRKHFKFNVSKRFISVRIFVNTINGEREAFDIARTCVAEWEAFFAAKDAATST